MPSVNPEQQSYYQQEAGTFLTIMDEMAPQVALDYSVESLQRLDQFISEHFEPPGAKFVSENLPMGIGCYLGEVIIRHLGGHWNRQGQAEVNNIGPIEAILPIEKAKKRFENGREDSLAWYYHSLAKQAYEGGLKPSKNKNHNHQVATIGTLAESDGGVFSFFKGFFKR